MITVTHLLRHPVKSLGSEPLDRATLRPGGAVHGDRRWAISHGNSAWSDAAPKWIPCKNFLRVAHAPKLAQIVIASDPASTLIAAEHPEIGRFEGHLSSASDREALIKWIAPLTGSVEGPFKLIELPSGAMTDSEDMSPSLKSLSSLRDLGEKVGTTLDPRRFRGNIWIDGAEPWAELDWIGRDIQIGDVQLRVTVPIGRCRATMANPDSGERDADTLGALKQHFGHTNFGVEVEIITGGDIAIGGPVQLGEAA